MATVKQTKRIYKKIQFHLRHLRKALYQADNLKVIQFDKSKWADESPNWSLSELDDRIDLTTERALASAMRQEIMKELSI